MALIPYNYRNSWSSIFNTPVSDKTTLVSLAADRQSRLWPPKSCNWECFKNTCHCEAIPIDVPYAPKTHFLVRVFDWHICPAHLANCEPGLAITRFDGFFEPAPSRYIAVSHVWSQKWFQGAKVKVCMKRLLEDIARYYKAEYLWIDHFCLPHDDGSGITPAKTPPLMACSPRLSLEYPQTAATSEQNMTTITTITTAIRDYMSIQISPNASIHSTSSDDDDCDDSRSVISSLSNDLYDVCSNNDNTETFARLMEGMGEIYRGAVCVIILTLETMIGGLEKLNHENFWMTRGWTVQEGASAKAICIPSILHDTCYAPIDVAKLPPTVANVLQRKDAGKMSLYTAFGLFAGRKFTKKDDLLYALFGLVDIDNSSDAEGSDNNKHQYRFLSKNMLWSTGFISLVIFSCLELWGELVFNYPDTQSHRFTSTRILLVIVSACLIMVIGLEWLMKHVPRFWYARRTPAKARRWNTYEWLLNHCPKEIDGRLLELPLAGQLNAIENHRRDLQCHKKRQSRSPPRIRHPSSELRPWRSIPKGSASDDGKGHHKHTCIPDISWAPLPTPPSNPHWHQQQQHSFSSSPLANDMDNIGTTYHIGQWGDYPCTLSATNVLYQDKYPEYLRGRGAVSAYFIRLRDHFQVGKQRVKRVDIERRPKSKTFLVKIADVHKPYEDLDSSRLELLEGYVVVA